MAELNYEDDNRYSGRDLPEAEEPRRERGHVHKGIDFASSEIRLEGKRPQTPEAGEAADHPVQATGNARPRQ